MSERRQYFALAIARPPQGLSADDLEEVVRKGMDEAGYPVGTVIAAPTGLNLYNRLLATGVVEPTPDPGELTKAAWRLVGAAQAGNWEGGEVPDPVAAEIAHIHMLIRGAPCEQG